MRAAKGHSSTGWKNPVPHMTQRSVQLNKSPQSLYRVCARAGVGSGLPGQIARGLVPRELRSGTTTHGGQRRRYRQMMRQHDVVCPRNGILCRLKKEGSTDTATIWTKLRDGTLRKISQLHRTTHRVIPLTQDV